MRYRGGTDESYGRSCFDHKEKKMAMPVNKVVVQRIDSTALGFGTLVFKIPETTGDYNMVYELLKAIQFKYPGVWAQYQRNMREQDEKEQKVKPVKELSDG